MKANWIVIMVGLVDQSKGIKPTESKILKKLVDSPFWVASLFMNIFLSVKI